MEKKIAISEKINYIRKSCKWFKQIEEKIYNEGKSNQFNEKAKELFPDIVKDYDGLLHTIASYFLNARELKIMSDPKTITKYYNQIIIYRSYINQIMEELKKLYGDKRIIEIGKPNTVRLHTKGIKLTDFINKDTYRTEKYCNPLTLKQGNVTPQLMGVAVQTYCDIKNNIFEPIYLVNNTTKWDNLADDYNYWKNFKNVADNEVIDFCILYADLVAHTRTHMVFDYYDVKNITENDRYNLLLMVNNINRFMEKKNLKIKYSEVDFRYREIVEREEYFIENVCFGDLDYITDNSILDLKCCKANKPVQSLSQQLLYYLMGCLGYNNYHIERTYFENMKEVGYYNPILDTYQYIKVNELSKQFKSAFLKRVMEHPLQLN